MRKVIAAINMSLDGFCDHTMVTPDDEVHNHYTNLLKTSDTLVYGRITYELMKFWKAIAANPTGNKTIDNFAATMDTMAEMVVFSHTLTNPDWKNARIAAQSLKEELTTLKQKPGKDILVGSPGLIMQCMNQNLIDEYQFCIFPIVVGQGMRLFENIDARKEWRLVKVKTVKCGAVICYYKPSLV